MKGVVLRGCELRESGRFRTELNGYGSTSGDTGPPEQVRDERGSREDQSSRVNRNLRKGKGNILQKKGSEELHTPESFTGKRRNKDP